ncbi:MAG: WD40/YVTN/BNR-like repeat-containing protein [Nitriliruptoraceae bacterium]
MRLPIHPRPAPTAPRWRFVGPPRGGRVVAVAGDPREAMTFWMGACSGGVFKTTDGGRYWLPMTDGWFGSPSVGAIAVADSDPNVVWVGTGEGAVRNNVVPGDGVYRTTDGGRTWDHLGLAATRHIPRVRVHPLDPDVAYVAAIGDIFGPNPERGVYRTTDGGRGWELVLHVDERTGAADLAMDPNNPRILFAAMWEAERKPWTMRSGGEGSGLYRSTDGGDSWELVSGKPGFAEGILGRMGVSVSPARSGRVFALVEAAEGQGGLYRSDDLGATWEQVSDHRGIQGRPWYYSHVVADPVHADTVYSMNLWAWRSTDGGRNWTQFQTPHGDNHGLWIDPRDPRRMINGNDGGACVSFNAGVSWSSIYNQPTAQLYRFDVDPRFPHDLYATQQDNSGIRVPSRSWKGAIRWDDCQELGEAESGDVALDPTDPTTVFLGGAGFGHPGPLLRFDRVTEQPADVAVWPEYFMGVGASEQRHRFGWTFPIEFSPHDPTVLYIGGERVFRSTDRGMSWEAISPDLTRDDPDKQRPSGGPISLDTSGAEIYCTIHAFAESPLTPGELWAGSDDGLVHVSVDGGASWRDVTPPELPAWSTVQRIEVSRHTPGTAYLAAHAYRVQDRRPLLFVTRDHGGRWERITAGIPEDEWTRTIREDTVASEVLYAGTERGPWMSRDGGSSWTSIAGNLPAVPIYDLRLLGHELIVATHGRGFWILDDVTPLREEPAELEDEALLLHELPPVYRYPTPNGFDMPGEGVWVAGTPGVPLGGASFTPVRQLDGSTENLVIEGGTNPPDGMLVHYRIGAALLDGEEKPEATLTIRTADGELVRRFHATNPEDHPKVPTIPVEQGLNRFVWDLTVEGAVAAPAEGEEGRTFVTSGPRIPPGTYEVELALGAQRSIGSLVVRRDPRAEESDEDLAAHYTAHLRISRRVGEIHRRIAQLRRVRTQLSTWADRVDEATSERLQGLVERLDVVERELTQPDFKDGGDRLKLPAGLDGKLAHLCDSVLQLSDAPPTPALLAVEEQLWGEAEAAMARLDTLLAEVASVDADLRAREDLVLIDLS